MAFDSLPFEPGARVRVPEGLLPPYQIYVNGIKQQRGKDYVITGTNIYFREALVREGKLGFWRWFSMFLGIGNTYRANDGVDIAYRANGKPQIFTALPIETLGERRSDYGQHGATSFEPAGR